MSLIEQKRAFMDQLQRLLDERSAEIDRKVAAYRESLEKEKLTDEMKQLVGFINQLDAMIAYENNTAAPTESEAVEEATIDEAPVAEEGLFEDAESVDEESTFSEAPAETVAAEEKEIANVERDTSEHADELVGTGFEALKIDADDTRAKLRAAEQARPGMPGIVPPRR